MNGTSHGSGNALWDLLSMIQRRSRVFNFELPPFFLFVSGTPMPQGPESLERLLDTMTTREEDRPKQLSKAAFNELIH